MALGDTGVGKSCFLVQYVEGRFMMKYVTTVGVDFFLRKLVSFQFDTFQIFKISIDIQLFFENFIIISETTSDLE